LNEILKVISENAFLYVNIFRERHGVVRNDLLGSLMELRNSEMKSVQENTNFVEKRKASSVGT
jgi:exosome complex RNA-binding protein Csl4